MYDRLRLILKSITKLQCHRDSKRSLPPWTTNINNFMNSLTDCLTLLLMSLLPLISCSSLEHCLGHFGSTRSTDQLPHMILAPSCGPRSLSIIMEILTSFLARAMSTPGSLVLLEIIIRADFLMILFLILMSVFLIFGTIDKTRTEAHFGRLYAL
jgi:hypothetical protein